MNTIDWNRIECNNRFLFDPFILPTSCVGPVSVSFADESRQRPLLFLRSTRVVSYPPFRLPRLALPRPACQSNRYDSIWRQGRLSKTRVQTYTPRYGQMMVLLLKKKQVVGPKTTNVKANSFRLMALINKKKNGTRKRPPLYSFSPSAFDTCFRSLVSLLSNEKFDQFSICIVSQRFRFRACFRFKIVCHSNACIHKRA